MELRPGLEFCNAFGSLDLFLLLTNPISTDEVFKASAYMSETYYYDKDWWNKSEEPGMTPYNYVFDCPGVEMFHWFEGKGFKNDTISRTIRGSGDYSAKNPNRFRLERIAKAMTGTAYFELPGAMLRCKVVRFTYWMSPLTRIESIRLGFSPTSQRRR
jgi:hypothetical protein